MGISFFNPDLVFFVGRLTLLPRRLIAFTMLHFGLCSLGLLWACRALSLLLNSCNPVLLLGLFSYYFWLPWPVLFLWASLAHSNPSFPWTFAKSFGLPRPNYYILYFRGLLAFLPTPFTNSFLWPIFACIPFFIILMGLLLLSLGSLRLTCFLWGLLTILPMNHYSCHSGLMIFFSLC